MVKLEFFFKKSSSQKLNVFQLIRFMNVDKPTDDREVEREAMEWARFLFDIYQTKKREDLGGDERTETD